MLLVVGMYVCIYMSYSCSSCRSDLVQNVYVDSLRDKSMIFECTGCGEEFQKCDSCSSPVVDGDSGRFEDLGGSGGKPSGHPNYGTVGVIVCSDCSLFEGLVGEYASVTDVEDAKERYEQL